MSIIIVLAASEESEKELVEMGFTKREVWTKPAPGITTPDQKVKGEALMWRMKHIPFQFLVSSWWGAGPG